MAIKKAFQPIVDFLEQNKDSKVKTVLDGVIELASAKTGGGGRNANNVLRDAEGNVIAVFCYYHKKFEPTAAPDAELQEGQVEYGKKATSSSGLNSMCKEGTSAWTKQQRVAKTASENLLDSVASGEVQAQDLEQLRADIRTAKEAIVPRADGIGFDTVEDATAALLG